MTITEPTYKSKPIFTSIYAIGDCIPGPMLAHKAEDEGIACVEGIAGNPAHINYNAIPSVIYTHPEVAWVGITEDEAKRTGIKYKIGKFPLSSNGRSRAVCEIDGFAKVIAEEGSDKLLGAHFISSCAGEVINQMSMAIEYGASAEDVARVCHAHPTVAECLKEACLQAYSGKPINTI
ncbi:Dihydrolipoyl dehydrogenase, mitochondrial [Thelohanellus kitauei]|uniref:Dihydrolipoamide dehydrogenase n=1 Tax=Thelohanellus kitauei TaxID=669202 RepID=A0A0C2NA36_THEKT|nr:Dihydrolipoyl dehydrogenase, mitochondrial [Thelohanellus kitauei]